MQLYVHALIQWLDAATSLRIERVLRQDLRHDRLLIIDIDDPRALPRLEAQSDYEHAVASAEARLLENDPYSVLRRLDTELAQRYGPTAWEKHRHRRDVRWAVIEPIVTALQDRLFDARQLGALVQRVHTETRHSKTHIYQYLRWYWQRGECRNALLPRYDRCGPERNARTPRGPKWGRPRTDVAISGAAPGINVDNQIREYFRRGTKMFYEQRDRYSLQRAFQKIEERFFNVGHTTLRNGLRIPVLLPREQRPTVRQYRYWFAREWDPVRTSSAREGKRRFNLSHRAVLGDYRASLGAMGPGWLFQIDATIGDLFLVSELERMVIGRPVIYLITDVFSTLITGFSVGLEGPSWAGAMLALEHMTLDKVAYCAEFGIIINHRDWPSQHLPRALCGDRGEMLSKASDTLTSSFNITVSNTAAYRPDWKGRIERDFRLINDGCLQWIPGHTNGWKERGERDCRLDACMTLREFTQYLADFIVEYNTLHQVSDELLLPAMIRDGVEPYPNELWLWGVENLSGALRTEPRGVVQRNLLPEAEARVTREGIRFRRLHYMCDRAREEHWVERARARKGWDVRILYDPRTPARIYLLHDGRNNPEPCDLAPRDARFATCTWADVEHHFALRLVESQELTEDTRQSRIAHEAQREAWIAAAERKTHEEQAARGPESKAARLAGGRERREAERDRDRADRSWTHIVDGALEDSPAGARAERALEDDNESENEDRGDATYEEDVLTLLRGEDAETDDRE